MQRGRKARWVQVKAAEFFGATWASPVLAASARRWHIARAGLRAMRVLAHDPYTDKRSGGGVGRTWPTLTR